MKIATWNVNSLKVRLPQVLDWLAANQPDVLCLQETKLQDENFPLSEIAAAGYQTICCGQKTYNGVALLSKQPGCEIISGIPGLDDPQKRVVGAIYGDLRVVCIYVPNGEHVTSGKYQYKLKWLAALREWVCDMLGKHQKLVLLGDFNIAPEERDVHDAKLWEGQVLFSLPEREAFREILELGLVDSFRLFEQPEKSYTWWDYRMMAFRRNLGLRIDHILLSSQLAKECTSCVIDKATRKLDRPSDHAPVVVELQNAGTSPPHGSSEIPLITKPRD
ncbi:MAG: exodeoxyribonuclease III [Nitrosospira sp.]|nr:exodeoxyribonuclease III [Nitrosospira sp.]